MVSANEIRRKAMDLLARREHSAKELKDKLGRRFDGALEIEAVVSVLSEEGLQSDQRFAESFCRQRIASGYGPMRIKMELVQRGIDQTATEAVLCSAQADWLALCELAREKKFGDLPGDAKERARQQRFLYYRGFSPSLINEILS